MHGEANLTASSPDADEQIDIWPSAGLMHGGGVSVHMVRACAFVVMAALHRYRGVMIGRME